MAEVSLPRAATRITPRVPPLGAAAAWAAVVVAGHLLAQRLEDADPLVHIGAPPVVGSFDVRLTLGVVPAMALGAAAVAWGPALAARLRWRALLAVTWLAGMAWILALAAAPGLRAVSAPLSSRYEYLAAVPAAHDAHAFLATFVDRVAGYPTHVKGHPPGLVLVLSALDRVALGGAGAAAALVIATGALAAPAALVALRALGDAGAARRAAPFVVFAPAAVWMGTSADALFAGVAAVGIAAFAVAATSQAARPRRLALAGGAGVVLGAALHLSYGVAPLGVLVLAIAAHRRASGALAVATLGVAVVFAASAAAGFWWPDGLAATRDLYGAGVASRRPYADFLVIGLAAFALALGPATVAGLARVRGSATGLLVAGAAVAVAAAALSGLSRGETERIWLPFAPWLLLAGAALGTPRRWLAAQVVLAVALQAGVRSPW